LSKLEKIPRIPRSIIDALPPPVVNTPSIAPPIVDAIAPPVIDVPSYEAPSYDPPFLNPEPAVVAPSLPGLTPPKPITEDDNRDLPPTPPKAEVPAPPPRPEMEVPFLGTVPLPYGREVALAGTTAIGATAAALLGKSIVEWLVKKFKPIVKKVMLKAKEKAGKQFTDYETQQFFDFEGRVPEQKSAAKRLAKEQKAEKARQLEVHLQQQRQRKR
jgi:hypothetical protein